MAKIYNELAWAKYLLVHGMKTYRARDVTTICKYYKLMGWKNRDIRKHVIQLCEDQIPDFNINILYKSLLSAIKKGCDIDKNPPIIVAPLQITMVEINWFNELDLSEVDKKILFTWYVLSQISENKEYKEYLNFHNTFGEFKRQANIKSNINMNEKIRKFVKLGYISVTINNSIKLEFLSRVPEPSGKIQFLINFYNIGYFFELNTKDTICCILCGEKTVKTGRNQKYCEQCAKEQQLIQKQAYKKNNKKFGGEILEHP